MNKIQELENALRKAKQEEVETKEKETLEKNYQKFLEREPDMVIGLAHADIGITKIDYRWQDGRFFTIGDAISIHGNMGTTYNARAPITSSTYTYFHNVWSDKQKMDFQKALNRVAIKEVKKIMSDLRCTLEIMGLQSEDFFVRRIYPQDKKEEILKTIEKERHVVLDKYTDKDFASLDVKGLSHSKGILEKYLKARRKNLLYILDRE